jgi:hypothetical protein
MPDFYPAWKVRLTVRLEEYADSSLGSPTKKKLITQLKGKKASRDSALQVGRDPSPNVPAGATRWLLSPKGTTADKPQDVQQSADNLTFRLGALIPKKMNWKANGIREADQLSFDLRFIDAPFDPRCLRSVAIEAYLGCVSPEEHVKGLTGEVRTSAGGTATDAEPLNVVPDTYTDSRGQRRTNLRFQGWADTWEVEWSDDGEPFVHVECRDNTTLMIDQDVAPQLAIDEQKGIDEAIATYLSNYPQYAGLSVEYRPSSGEVPKLGAALGKTAFKPKLGLTPSKNGGATGDAKLSVWDYLTDVCGAIGHICKVEGTVMVVQRARTATSHGGGQRPTDPFGERNHDGVQMPRRTLIYGRNLSSMKIGRKYSRSVPQVIEVRCYNGKRKNTMVVRYPEHQAAAITPALPGDDRTEHRVHVVRVSGIEDEKSLRVVAQSYYEAFGRRELSIHLKTNDLGSYGGGNSDPDLLDMQPGDQVDVLIHRDSENEPSTVTTTEAKLLVQQSAVRMLQAAGYAGDFAAAYAKTYAAIGYQTTFVVRNFSFDCDIEDGVTGDIEVCNYVAIRAEQVLPDGEEQNPREFTPTSIGF